MIKFVITIATQQLNNFTKHEHTSQNDKFAIAFINIIHQQHA